MGSSSNWWESRESKTGADEEREKSKVSKPEAVEKNIEPVDRGEGPVG